jgi:DNA polymerase-1
VEWVAHEGVIPMGVKSVMTWDGLTATPDHEVYTFAGTKVRLEEAASCSMQIAVGSTGSTPVKYGALLPSERVETSALFGDSGVVAPVYDLLNAGPRHRFTVEGKVVSNCYGMQPPKLVLYARAGYGVTMSLKEATVYRERYFEKFAGIAKWHLMAQRNGQRQKMAWSIAGRLRYLDTGEFFNEYYNMPVQSTGADGLKTALRCVYNRFKKLIGRPPTRIKDLPEPAVKMVHHVHDEIISEAKDDKDFIEAVKHEQEEGMKEGMQPLLQNVPVSVEASSGYTWADKS